MQRLITFAKALLWLFLVAWIWEGFIIFLIVFPGILDYFSQYIAQFTGDIRGLFFVRIGPLWVFLTGCVFFIYLITRLCRLFKTSVNKKAEVAIEKTTD